MLYNISLFAIWILLIGDTTIDHMTIGALLVLVTRVTMYYMNVRIANPFNIQIIFYIPWLIKELWCSAMTVVKIIWGAKIQINSSFEYISTLQKTTVGKVLYAHSITLTPGTYTLDIGDDLLLVHSLVKQKEWSSVMDNKIMEAVKC
jgi:multicomponent Na+:H+ antiporter subunit E